MNRENQALTFQNFLYKAQQKILKPDLAKDPAGNNFRAISEANILEEINPFLFEFGVDYSVKVLKYNISETQHGYFLADCLVRLDFFVNGEEVPIAYSEALGMGLDTGDKAIGKAYTYAVKYALLKKLRLLYADDPDYKTSEKPNRNKAAEEPKKSSKGKSTKKEEKTEEELLITPAMTNYIVGLVMQTQTDKEEFFKKWGYYPKDKNIPMKLARKIIDDLKALAEDLPF